MYRPPNNNPSEFVTCTNTIASKVTTEKKELIMGMDHNLDLLKTGIHKHTTTFLEDLVDKNIMPIIMYPTHITQNTAILIDNIFVSEKIQKFFEPVVILDDISDHLPTLALLKQTKLLDKKLLEFKSHNLSREKVNKIKNMLYQIDWTRHLSANDCSRNFNKFLTKVNDIMDTVSPLKTIRIFAKRKYVEPWMTQGLEVSGCTKLCLYKEILKRQPSDIAITNYKNYQNQCNKAKRALKISYYRNKAYDYVNDTKKLWNLLNEVIGKTKRCRSTIPYITINGLKNPCPINDCQ